MKTDVTLCRECKYYEAGECSRNFLDMLTDADYWSRAEKKPYISITLNLPTVTVEKLEYLTSCGMFPTVEKAVIDMVRWEYRELELSNMPYKEGLTP